jgi:chaperone modulatory protein CbpM
MVGTRFMRLTDFDLDEPLTSEAVAELVGARNSLVARLVREGLLESVSSETGEPLLPTRSVLRLRQMQRLRRDLRVNFTGAAIIIDLVARIERLNRELECMRRTSTS